VTIEPRVASAGRVQPSSWKARRLRWQPEAVEERERERRGTEEERSSDDSRRAACAVLPRRADLKEARSSGGGQLEGRSRRLESRHVLGQAPGFGRLLGPPLRHVASAAAEVQGPHTSQPARLSFARQRMGANPRADVEERHRVACSY
jgi:hypothetical protein